MVNWDGTITFGNVLTIATTLIGLVGGGFKIAFHLQRSSDALNNLAAITERLQESTDKHDNRISHLETEQEIQREVSKRLGAMNPVVQVNK